MKERLLGPDRATLRLPVMNLFSHQTWRYVRGLAAPVLLWGIFLAVLLQILPTWLRGDEEYDKKALREWIEEARVSNRDTLPEVVRDYLEKVHEVRRTNPSVGPADELALK